jgi:2-phosphosulfolactate phosphatase
MPAIVRVHALPTMLPAHGPTGAQAVIVDLLRASTTICAALHAGAPCVRPVLEPGEARALRDRLAPRPCLLGGERDGVLIPGFDLANSPREYTPQRVRNRDVIFTTTNGTRAIHAAASAGAARVVIGCLANLSALVGSLVVDGRHVHVICAGTNGEVSMEDVLCAGAIVSRLVAEGLVHHSDDQSRIAQRLFESAATERDGVLNLMLRSRGGRNLVQIGLADDVRDCAESDWLPVVPVFDAAAGAITPAA